MLNAHTDQSHEEIREKNIAHASMTGSVLLDEKQSCLNSEVANMKWFHRPKENTYKGKPVKLYYEE